MPIVTVISTESSYRLTEEPTVIPTFWFEDSGLDASGEEVSLHDAQNISSANPVPVYCNNSEYNCEPPPSPPAPLAWGA